MSSTQGKWSEFTSKARLFTVLLAILMIIIVAVMRLIMLGADFPPISASVSEYGDMGYCLQNVRSKLLEDDWNFSKTAVSLGSPLHSLLVYVSARLLGISGASVSTVSACAFLLLWLAAFHRWSSRLSTAAVATGLLLLGFQHVVFAYSYSWKQEMLMVSLAILGLLPLDRRDRKGIVASGIILSLAILTKFSAIGVCCAALGSLLLERVSVRQRAANFSLWIGAFLILPISLLAFAKIMMPPPGWDHLIDWLIAIGSDRIAIDYSISDRVANLFRMNFILRCLPEMTIGLALAIPSFFDKSISRLHQALIIVIAIHLVAPLVAPYYPLRWILPASAAAVFLAVEGIERFPWKPAPASWVVGALFSQATGFVLWRHGNASLLVILVVSVITLFVTAYSTRFIRAGELVMRRVLLLLLLVASLLHGMVAIGWIVERRFDQARLSRSIEETVLRSEGEFVSPLTFIGWQVLWPTRLAISDDHFSARFVLWDSTVPEGYWTIPEDAEIRFESRIPLANLRVILYELMGTSARNPQTRP